MAELHLPHADAHGSSDHTVDHERSDVNIRAILGTAAGLVGVTAVVFGLVWLLFVYFDARARQQTAREYPLAVEQENRLPPEPRLQTNPRQDLSDLRSDETQTLTTYGWVDRNAGIVRIPIDEAMKLVIQRGLPARQEQPR